jgi:hypothetical protein
MDMSKNTMMTLDDVPTEQLRIMQVESIVDDSHDNEYIIKLRDIVLDFVYYDKFNIQTNSIGYLRGRLAAILGIKGTTESWTTKSLVEAVRSELAKGAVIVKVELEYVEKLGLNKILCYRKRMKNKAAAPLSSIPLMEYKPFDPEQHYVEALLNGEWVGVYYLPIKEVSMIGRQCDVMARPTDLFCILFSAHRAPMITAWESLGEDVRCRQAEGILLTKS